ncbi:HdeD family acid-resistance protein [Breznakiella homolactica]|uniref:DUF308 domain-containing protein n=1 Tax=Breznakiella homolactica TaxID=2798577 RepID=A0A7T7XMA2_9SPIR|nr:DUF308 domain-containing protein [Breznakiella homolactica]QQO08984.1 DUF308 domain-containing protein [Breznakiella homolactica]
MSDSTEKRSFHWGYLILGILLIITAFIAFRNPVSDILAITVVFGIMAVASGIWMIVYSNKQAGNIVIGILDIIIGIILLFNIGAGVLAIPYVFAIWFILDSVFRLVNIKYAKLIGKGYFWFSLIVNILCILAGIALLFNPIASILTISFLLGFYFVLAGIGYIVYAFNGDR